MTKEKLKRLYITKGLPKSVIGVTQGISIAKLQEMFKKWKIPSRGHGYQWKDRI
jgi:hypothetical protein